MNLEIEHPSFVLQGKNDTIVKLYHDGRVELGEGVTLDEAAIAFWAAVQRAGLDIRAEMRARCAAEARREIHGLPVRNSLGDEFPTLKIRNQWDIARDIEALPLEATGAKDNG